MQPFQQDQIERFLRENQPAIAGLLNQAYAEAGGHYAALSPEERQHQAAIDSGEYVDGLMHGVDRATVQAAAHHATAAGIDVNDILRMSNALERQVTAFVREHLAGQPDLAQEVLRRAHNVAASFRTNLAAARLDDVLRRFEDDSR
jgi:hypothetical protein